MHSFNKNFLDILTQFNRKFMSAKVTIYTQWYT